MNESDIKAIFEQAVTKRREADIARDKMAEVMLVAIRKLLPPGTVLELNKRPVPEYLVRVKTMRGNDRGTRTFRVVSVVAVEVDPHFPELAKWICDAVPVSEKTGKDMSAATHGSTRGDTVRLHGDVGCFRETDSAEEVLVRMAQLVAAHA
jgi:hypothetical protein